MSEKNKNQVKLPIFNHINIDDCCGCEGCFNVCKTNAIKMIEDEEGFRYPEIISDNCVGCLKCEKVCPVISSSENRSSSELETIVGYAKNSSIVDQSSSGGFFGIIAKSFLTRGVVVGVTWSDDFKSTEHILIDCPENLNIIQRSKYIQSQKKYIYRDVYEKLKNNNKVLFTGCPCEVAALKMQIPENLQENLYLIDLVCQGPSSSKAMSEFVDYIEKKYKSHITDINMRLAIGPWIPQYIKIIFENGESFVDRLYDTALGDAIRIMQRLACYNCRFAGAGRKSDLTLGDYHGADKAATYYNESGISVAIAHSDKGKELLKILKNTDVYWENGDYNDIAKKNPRIEAPWSALPERTSFSNEFVQNGLFEASKKITSNKRRLFRTLPLRIRLTAEKKLKKGLH